MAACVAFAYAQACDMRQAGGYVQKHWPQLTLDNESEKRNEGAVQTEHWQKHQYERVQQQKPTGNSEGENRSYVRMVNKLG